MFQALKRECGHLALKVEFCSVRHTMQFQALKRECGHLAGQPAPPALPDRTVSSPQAGMRPFSLVG